MKTPVMTAEDKTFVWGQVGIGLVRRFRPLERYQTHGIKYIK